MPMPKQIRDNLDMHFDAIITASWDQPPPPPHDPTNHGRGGGGNDPDNTWHTAILVISIIGTGIAAMNTTLIIAIGGLLLAPTLGHLLH